MNKYNSERYTVIARCLHWLIAGLIIAQYILAELAEYAEQSSEVVKQLGLLANHKSIGMTVLMLAAVRLTWRCFHRPPPLPSIMPVWQRMVSAVMHWLLYGLIFALPVSGWLMSSTTAYSVSWFNLFVFPDLLSANENLAELFKGIHQLLSKLLAALAVVHIVAAMKHWFLDRDFVLGRMLDPTGLAIMIISLIMSVALFGIGGNQSSSKQAPSLVQENGVLSELTSSRLPTWDIDYQDSYIRFSGDQAGAPFEGQWRAWEAVIQFQRDRLRQSRFDVTVDTRSVFSGDAERDGYIVATDFFDVANYLTARFVADRFIEISNNRFSSIGQLNMKGIVSPATLDFSIEEAKGKVILKGTATLDRLQWNIGVGDWADTSWVGQNVTVEVRVVAVK